MVGIIRITMEKKLKKNKEKIVNLLNQNIDLEYKLLVKRMKKTYDKEVNLGTKKVPRLVNVTFGMWYEFFKDEDTNQNLKLERHMPIAVDGKPSDHYRLIEYYSLEDLK